MGLRPQRYTQPAVASVFDETPSKRAGVRDDRRQPLRTEQSGATAPDKDPTFVVTSASAPAVAITEPVNPEELRGLLSAKMVDAAGKARRKALNPPARG